MRREALNFAERELHPVQLVGASGSLEYVKLVQPGRVRLLEERTGKLVGKGVNGSGVTGVLEFDTPEKADEWISRRTSERAKALATAERERRAKLLRALNARREKRDADRRRWAEREAELGPPTKEEKAHRARRAQQDYQREYGELRGDKRRRVKQLTDVGRVGREVQSEVAGWRARLKQRAQDFDGDDDAVDEDAIDDAGDELELDNERDGAELDWSP
jgi:hypothetical protein